MRTIRVTGKGQIKVHPDMTRITITLEGLHNEYGDALRHSSEDTEQMKDIISEFGFERSDLKTLNFSVDPQFESYKVKDTYRQRFVGYRYVHLLKLEFESDNVLLGRVLYALAHCALKPRFQLSYTVKDQEAARNELIGRAVIDAKEKAKVLTNAAGVSLKDIQSIDYSWGRIDFDVRPMRGDMLAEEEDVCCASAVPGYAMDIEPDDINISDTVTVIWEIA